MNVREAPQPPDPPVPLLGRDAELGVLERLLDDVRAGRSAVVVVRGEAGIGKTALLRHVAKAAAGFRLVRAAGAEAEMELPFAGIHQLCAPMLGRLPALPAPQRAALEVAFGIAPGAVPERFLIGVATLGLLSAAAERQPVVCLVEDAQWLDAASAQVLGFVARRLLAESVAIVIAVREPADARELDGLPVLSLEGLPDADARALLARTIPGRLDDRVRDRIVAETRGNPLALLELPQRMTPAELAGGFELPTAGGLPAHIEHHYLRRVTELPEATQRLMLLAAADPSADPTLVWRAGRTLDIATSALAAAEEAELLEIGARVRFRHPLVRSAVYSAASPESRQRVHRALAEASDPAADADRRAWHHSLAAAGPDEDVATELERSAGRAEARGGLAAAAAFLERAVALTQDPARRRERALAAARTSLAAGSFEAAMSLLAVAEAGTPGDRQRALIDLLRAQVAFASSRGTEALPLLLSAARRLEPLDVALARETYADAFSAAMFGARLNGDVGVREVARAAGAAPAPVGKPRAADLLLDALVALSDDYGAAVPACRRAVSRLQSEEVPAPERLRWLWQGCVVALEVWDHESAYALSRRDVQLARETSALAELSLALSAHTPTLVLGGELAAAAATVAESRSVEDATGIRTAPYGALVLEAWRGRPEETRELIRTTEREAAARGEGVGIAIADYARAVMCNGLGLYEEAVEAAGSASAHHEVVAENWGLSELVEPAARTGRRDLAMDALGRLTTKARATGAEWALGIEARSRALVSDDEAAFREAIVHLGRTRLRGELARTHLLYGEWLRRAGRRVDARAQLRRAHGRFSAMGMEAFAARARTELRATGESVRSRSPETRDDLTAQQRQIAELARDGLSNAEIGVRLFLSPRTVEWHLGQVFTKLGVRSRRQLATVLPARRLDG